jgi:exonuclease I
MKSFELISDNNVAKSDVGILDSVSASLLFHWRTRCVCNSMNFKQGQRWQVFAQGHSDEYKGTLTVASVNVEKSRVTFKEFLPRPVRFPLQFVFPGDLLVLIPKGLE